MKMSLWIFQKFVSFLKILGPPKNDYLKYVLYIIIELFLLKINYVIF